MRRAFPMRNCTNSARWQVSWRGSAAPIHLLAKKSDDAIAQALQSYWPISAEVARIAAEATLSGISLDTDPLRLAQELLDITDGRRAGTLD